MRARNRYLSTAVIGLSAALLLAGCDEPAEEQQEGAADAPATEQAPAATEEPAEGTTTQQ